MVAFSTNICIMHAIHHLILPKQPTCGHGPPQLGAIFLYTLKWVFMWHLWCISGHRLRFHPQHLSPSSNQLHQSGTWEPHWAWVPPIYVFWTTSLELYQNETCAPPPQSRWWCRKQPSIYDSRDSWATLHVLEKIEPRISKISDPQLKSTLLL
jgi:hypothetical protein